MSAWAKVPFSELLIESRDGEWGEGSAKIGHLLCEMIRGTDFAYLNGQNIELPRRWIPDHLVERKKLQIGDIVFEMAGGTAKQSTGRSAILNEKFFEQHKEHPVLCASFCRHLRLNQERFNPQFIYFMLQALYGAGYMSVYNIQHTGVSRFQYTSFKKMTVLNIPSLVNQEKIAAILSAYDDLIENNQRRIALLEKMAEEIYREWFVRMRFPGHKQVKFEKGVPEGWEIRRFGEFCRLKRGYDLPDSQIESGEFPVIASTSIKALHNEFKVKPPVITTGRSGSLGQVMWVSSKAWPLNTTLYVQNFFGNSPYLVFYILKNMGLENFNAGAGVPSLNRNHLDGIPVAVPSKKLQAEFDLQLMPIFSKKESLVHANQCLVTSRDMLLNRLISGKLSVENLDIHFPPSMREAGHDQ